MNEFIAFENIEPILTREILWPTVVLWNRLEGRPRKQDFSRALKAEIRDPLWMLTKQWQVGEFKGDDAASPVFAKAHIATTKLTQYQPDGRAVRPFDNEVPLEATVEQRKIPFTGQNHILSLDIRLLMGRQWLKLLRPLDTPDQQLKRAYIDKYGIKEPNPTSRDDAHISAHPEAWQHFAALAGRAMDGAELYFYLKEDSSHHAFDDIPGTGGLTGEIDLIAEKFINWYEALFYQPHQEANDAWIPEQLEYQFGVSAPQNQAEKVLVAEAYYHGHLDWYNLDIDRSRESLADGPPAAGDDVGLPPENVEGSITHTFIPTTIQFEGMPNTRWWTFEEGRTNFGDINPDTTDINKLLLIEFGLVYANDWFLVPFTLPVGTVAEVKGLAVTNVFGERTWVEASGSRQDEDWQTWAMYNLAIRGTEQVTGDTSLLLLPTVPKIGESKPLEEVYVIRDEVSNMVWGIEKRVPLPHGQSKPGREAAIELLNRYEQILNAEIEGELVIPEEVDYKAPIRYEIMNTVPENWIPFIPVHKDGDNREIQLQRASLPRVLPGDPARPEKVKPRTSLLRHGLEATPAQRYYLFEEDVPRAGLRVVQSYQRTRWHDGRVFTWLGGQKQIGHGEGLSRLGFDQILPTGVS